MQAGTVPCVLCLPRAWRATEVYVCEMGVEGGGWEGELLGRQGEFMLREAPVR